MILDASVFDADDDEDVDGDICGPIADDPGTAGGSFWMIFTWNGEPDMWVLLNFILIWYWPKIVKLYLFKKVIISN